MTTESERFFLALMQLFEQYPSRSVLDDMIYRLSDRLEELLIASKKEHLRFRTALMNYARWWHFHCTNSYWKEPMVGLSPGCLAQKQLQCWYCSDCPIQTCYKGIVEDDWDDKMKTQEYLKGFWDDLNLEAGRILVSVEGIPSPDEIKQFRID